MTGSLVIVLIERPVEKCVKIRQWHLKEKKTHKHSDRHKLLQCSTETSTEELS